MPQSIREQQAFNQQLRANPDLLHINLPVEGGSLHAVLMPPLEQAAATRQAVVFVHGTPGSWGNAGYYLADETLRSKAWLVSFDRLGWGESSLLNTNGRGQAAADFATQAKAITVLLNHLRKEKDLSSIVLVGHSLGASIAPQVALEAPTQVDGLLLLAGSLDPALGGPRWFNRLAAIPGMYYVLPEDLVRSNREIMALEDNLLSMQDRLGSITIPVTLIQGLQDGLVYPENIDFMEKTLASPPLRAIRLPEAGHLINFEHKPLVVDELTRLLDSVRNR